MRILKENSHSAYQKLLFFIAMTVLISVVSCRRHEADPTPAAAAPQPADSNQKVAQADQLYNQRDDLTKVRQSIILLRQARTADYGNYDAAWKLARADYYLGSHTSDDKERSDAFVEGIQFGKMAVQLNGDKPEGHFWLGANYGGDAEHSTLAGLANVEDIRQEMESVIKADEGYNGGSAYLGLGQLYLKAPRALGGDNQMAIEYLEKGSHLAGDNAMIKLNLAQAYHAAKRDADARKQINEILSMKPNPNYLPEYKDAVEGAKKLNEQIGQQQ